MTIWFSIKNMTAKYNLVDPDQWGNIVSGIDLIKKEKNKQVYGLTSPL